VSLRTRIALAAAFAVAAVAVVLSGASYLHARTQLVDNLRQQLRQRAAPALRPHGGNPVTSDGDRRGAEVCEPTDHRDAPHAEFAGAAGYFQSVCPNGRVVADAGGTPQLPVTPKVMTIAKHASGSWFFEATVQKTHIEILATGDAPDHKAVEVALPLTTVDSTLHTLRVTDLLLIGAGCLLAALVGLLVARAAVAPIRRFTARTEAVTSALEHPKRLDEDGPQELRRLAASFNQTLGALERSVEAQRHLIADASHELRTPMAALRSNIQIFLDAERLPIEERRGLQDAIVAELDELTQLVSDVLALARGAGSSDHLEPIELDAVIAEAIERTQRRAPGLRFETDIQPTVVEHAGDVVTRAVVNVLDNARKWSPPDGVIAVGLHDGVLTVRDHGPGFAAADVEHVFDRFYRSDRARRMPGAGLGLAIVKQAAEARGGFASAGNAPDGGGVVRVSFGPATTPAVPRPQPVGSTDPA
jgi:two-component system sensor histidine kinase MprB